MKKTIRLQDLDCASCAAKIESAIEKIDGVVNVKVNFMTQKMSLEADDDRYDDILKESQKIAKKIEPDIVFLN